MANYNNYFPQSYQSGYNLYGATPTSTQPYVAPAPTTNQPTGITWVQGEAAARAYPIAAGGNSYARGGNSYARGGQGGNSYYGPMYPMYDMGGSYMDGNSYNMNYGQGYGMPMYGRGYARTSSKEEMAMELKELMSEAKDEATRKAISEAIAKLEK